MQKRLGPLLIATVCGSVLALGVGAGLAQGQGAGPRWRHLAPPSAGTALKTTDEFGSTANPTTLDPPVTVPPTAPKVVTVADHVAFGNNPPPAVTTVNLPKGRWATIVLDVVGTESGRQFDRLNEVFDGPTEIFLGVTPEPTPAGITWHVKKDITGYLPILTGQQTFSTYVDNFLSSIDNGIPIMTVKLLFYPPGSGFHATKPATMTSSSVSGDAFNETGPAPVPTSPVAPSAVVPLLPAGAQNTLNTISAGQSLDASVTLPPDLTTVTLDLYAVGQIGDEFWFGLQPGFREIEVSIDGRPAGVVWPFPYVYTGGVNPLIWRPITGISTLDVKSYRVDLTPFAGTLAGTHTFSLTVANNTGYWLAGGSLMLGEGGQPTTGTVLTDTLTFPTLSHTVTKNALGSTTMPVTSESAKASYELQGQITAGGQTWTATINQQLQFGDDQSNINPTCTGGPCYQWLHTEETQSTSATVIGPGKEANRRDQSTWTVNAPNGFLQSTSGFFLPASVSQELTDLSDQSAPGPAYSSNLTESIIGYGALEEDNSQPTLTNGETTGTISLASPGRDYRRTVVARGGVVEQNLVSGS